MNEFLKNHYGTGAESTIGEADALEKMAQLTLLTKEAEEEGIDLSELSDDEVMQLADELYGDDIGGDSGEVGDDDMEKEAAAKFEESDFLGRVMAHSMWQELDSIQKEAGIKDLARRGFGGAKNLLGRARKAATGAAETVGGKTMGEKTRGSFIQKARKEMGERNEDLHPTKVRKLTGELYQRAARRRGAAIMGGGAALGLGGAGAGAYALKKKGSALNTLVEQRAIEHLAAAGYVDQQGNVFGPEQEKTASDQDFNTMVDRAALELLQQNGYPVQWK